MRARTASQHPGLPGSFLAALFGLSCLLLAACGGGGSRSDDESPDPGGSPVTKSHPRLWITADELPRLRSLATDSNPYWQEGLNVAATRAKAAMDDGHVPGDDCGDIADTEYPTETYAAFFAFLSLLAPEAERADYAQRARSLLMHVITEADKGPAPAQNFTCGGNQQYPRFRHPDFATEDRDRARYYGESFALAVDWIYATLSAADKAAIRRVFLRWSEEIIQRGYRHPEPVGLVNNPSLLEDQDQLRFSGNNYYAAHMRNLGLMALALDEADDLGGQLRAYLDNATGARLFILKALLEGDSAGGLLPEGFEYSPQTAGYAAQFLLALNTTGEGGDDANGLSAHAFWNDYVSAYLHSLSPATVVREPDRGDEYEPAFYGDAQNYHLPDFIDSFAPLGIHDLRAGNNPARLNAARWIALNTPAGGAARVLERISNPTYLRESLLYFLLLDPAVTPSDPHASVALNHFASGPQRLFARTGWDTQASWFTYALSWNSIDHQNAEGNSFAFYRKGEWLTKTRVGYADIGESIASTEYANGLCIQNDQPDRDETDWRTDLWKRGSQWYLVSDDDPEVLAQSFGADYAYALGDATRLYNSANENSSDVRHASRSILWLQPDAIFVYDRAESRSANRFKRFWLQLANPASLDGNRAVSATPGGQVLGVTSLLPSGGLVQNVATDAHDPEIDRKIADHEPMRVRLSITAPGNARSARFLTVLQGADSVAQLQAATLVQSSDSAWRGAVLDGAAMLFPNTLGGSRSFTLTLPAGVTRVLVTGLAANGLYTLTRSGNALTLSEGGPVQRADAGGVLDLRF
ncbi:MAG: hypothetical protein ACT4PZ_08005 [Panacagrimonas sp.]